MTNPTKILCYLALLLCIPSGSASAGQESPAQVVKRFCAKYGGPDMDEIARSTTPHFRNNRPESVWVADTWRRLRQVAYRRLQEEIFSTKTDHDQAAVILEAKIGTCAGQTTQKEVYYLIKKNDAWLIDELEIVDENVEVFEESQRL